MITAVTKDIGAVVTVVFVFVFLICSGCSGDGKEYSLALQNMITEKWAAYGQQIGYPGAGGAALYIDTPSGTYFVSTNMDKASPDIHFRVASNTKTFTAAAIMLLYQRGLLNIDDLITANIPGTSTPYVPTSADYNIPYKGSITIRQLLSHTAGVFDVTNGAIPDDASCTYKGQYYPSTQAPDHQYTFDELVGVVALCNVSYWSPTLGKYHYSNTGYNLLGKIIERVSGLAYSDFIMTQLIGPNGFSKTTAPWQSTDIYIPDPFPVGYSLSTGQLIEVTSDNMSLNVAEGNMISTPRELARWIRDLVTSWAGLDEATVRIMTDCTVKEGETSCYALGVEYRPGMGYGHNGAHNGYLSDMGYDPSNGVTVVVFSSLLNFDDISTEAGVLLSIVKEAKRILGY